MAITVSATSAKTVALNFFKSNAREMLLALAQAHEAKELNGPHKTYVWGCIGGTNRAPRRTARVVGILRALGADVSAAVDAKLT